MSVQRSLLVVLSGLPGTGKTTVARELARRTVIVHLRVDTIEHAIASSRMLGGSVNELGDPGQTRQSRPST